jgi:hypothetical protein
MESKSTEELKKLVELYKRAMASRDVPSQEAVMAAVEKLAEAEGSAVEARILAQFASSV